CRSAARISASAGCSATACSWRRVLRSTRSTSTRRAWREGRVLDRDHAVRALDLAQMRDGHAPVAVDLDTHRHDQGAGTFGEDAAALDAPLALRLRVGIAAVMAGDRLIDEVALHLLGGGSCELR